MGADFFSPVEGGLRLRARVSPRASRNCIDGIARDGEGQSHLVIKVTAPPEKDKANKAVIGLLAKALGLPQSDLQIVAGKTSRAKQLLLKAAGDEELAERSERLAALLTAS